VRRANTSRFHITWKLALGWIALVAVLLTGADLAERLLLYDVTRKDEGSLVRFARRPVKDMLLSLLHMTPARIEPPPVALPAAAREGRPEQSVPVFDFYLKPEDEAFLRQRIERVQLIGTHDEVTKEEVPARMSVDGQDYDVRINLRGRQYYHVVAARPSLRVELRHGRSYRGASVFNLVEPFDKTGDQIFLWESLEHDLIGWDATMGILAMRGQPVGVVQYVEQPRIETAHRAARAEGMFFRGSGEHYSEGADPERCSAVVKRVVRWLGDTAGTIPWEELQELFDVERLQWFTALTEFSGDGHGFADFNMKGFCDPVTLKAEMMIWDTRFGDWSNLATSQFAEEGTQLLRCDRFRLLHDQALYALASDRLEPMLARIDEFYARYGELMAQDSLHAFPRGGPDGGFMADRPEKLRRTLTKNAADIRAALTGTHLVWHLDRAARTLELATDDRGSKEIVAFEIEGGDGVTVWNLPQPIVVPGRYRAHQPVRIVSLPADVPTGALRAVRARSLCGGGEVRGLEKTEPLTGERVSWDPARTLAPLPVLPEGISADPDTGELRIGPGTVCLSVPLSLPRGWRVRVEPATELRLAPAVFVEIRGDLEMPGRADAPIVVAPAGSVPWGSFAVLGERTSPVKAWLAHTTFRGGAGSNAGSVRCTGSAALYFTEVVMDHVTIEQNSSEDAINLKHSTVKASDCLYRDGSGDAVDYDFCTGTDSRTRVERFGSEGIEVSGSHMRVEGAVVRETGGKGLSAGDASTLECADTAVIGAHTGVAVKDGSNARFERLSVVRADTALALYVKKGSLGPSRAHFSELRVVDTPAMAVLDQDCAARFEDGVRLGANGRGMRTFDGVRNEVVAGLDELDLDELLALALR
jgi:hypothetical protein